MQSDQGDNPIQETEVEPGQERNIVLREEQLRVEKEPIETGEVRVSKRVITEERTITVPIQREELVIERYPIHDQNQHTSGDRVEREEDASTDFNGQTINLRHGESIRIPLYAEKINVTKTPVVTEEVVLGKRIQQEERQVTDTVRKEKLHIDHSGNLMMDKTNPNS